MSDATPLLIGTDTQAVRALGEALAAECVFVPAGGDAAQLEAWRAEVASAPRRERIVVAAWRDLSHAGELIDLDRAAWDARAEQPLLLWNLALGAASARCADAGSLVAVVEAPAAIDARGFAPESGIADAVIALVRSLSLSEGARGVRANAVTTPARLGDPQVALPAPPLASFPGRIEQEVVGAVRLLLSADASGLTGRVLAADCGRS